LRFGDLARWAEDDHAAAFATFCRSAEALTQADAVLRPGKPASGGLLRVAELAVRATRGPFDPRAFFEDAFEPYDVAVPGGRGFLTGYFEPVVDASPVKTAGFRAPLLARPDDLVTLGPGEAPAGFDPRLQAARRTASGLEPYPERADIEEGALGSRARPIAYLADDVAVFIIQVQGSARLRFPDGRTARAVYAGRNGRPYTSIGRILIDTGRIPLEEMSLERLTAWLRAHPDEARAVMRRNASYVFFALVEDVDPDAGPIGGAGLPLTPGRSLAVDRSLWSYGLPFWLEGELPRPNGGLEALDRLMIAQDTGSAIVGAARGDFFVGTGPEAGTRAGLIRHPARFVVLLPKGEGPR
jgi:membrane-bound lytic murein transglycosylase A